MSEKIAIAPLNVKGGGKPIPLHFRTDLIGFFAVHPLRPLGPALLVIPLIGISCAKERFSIGHGAASQEIEQCIHLSERKHFEEAVQCLEIFKSRFPGTVEGQEAELRIGDSYYDHKEYLLAAETYEAFLKVHPTHSKVDYAHYRIGLSYLRQGPKAIDRDQGYLNNALTAFETVIGQFPTSSYAEAAQQQRKLVLEKIGRRHLYIGNFYYRTGEYKAAIPRLMEILQNYPETGSLDTIAYQVVRANLQLGQFDAAKAIFGKMDQAFPGSDWTKRAERLMLRKAHHERGRK